MCALYMMSCMILINLLSYTCQLIAQHILFHFFTLQNALLLTTYVVFQIILVFDKDFLIKSGLVKTLPCLSAWLALFLAIRFYKALV